MTIAPLTTTLHGFSAVHYASATGVTLRRREVQYAPGVPGDRVEPARDLAIDEATALLQHNQAERDRISCIAIHGERPYRGGGPVEIDWSALHAAALVIDAERHAVGYLGYDGISDAFGGSYFPATFELSGLPGAVRLLASAHAIRGDAWQAVHRAHRIGSGGRELAACGLRTALALDHLFRGLVAVGVFVYDPKTQICGVTGYEPDDTVQVTGLGWLAGTYRDPGSPTMREVSDFLASTHAGGK